MTAVVVQIVVVVGIKSSDDELVRFDLREVRIEGEVDSDCRTRNEPCGQTEIETDWFVDDASGIDRALGCRQCRNEAAVLRDSQTRNQFDRAFDGDTFKPRQVSFLAQIAVDAARERHPRVELIFETLDAPKEVRPQSLPLPASKRSDSNGMAISTLKPVL